jgi:hypothetical protein
MRKFIGIICAIAITGILLPGCDKVNDLNTKTFDATFSTDLNCSVPVLSESRANPTFSASAVINPTSDPNVNIYLNNIKSYEIQSLKGTITSMSQENVTLVLADLNIYNFQDTASWAYQNELLTVGKVLEMGNENGQWDKVSGILKDGQEFTVLITGETDFAGVTFTIKVDIETKVTANII